MDEMIEGTNLRSYMNQRIAFSSPLIGVLDHSALNLHERMFADYCDSDLIYKKMMNCGKNIDLDDCQIVNHV